LSRRAALLALLAWPLAAGCATTPSSERPAAEATGPRNFVVMIEGRNFLFDYEGRPTRFGFATSRNIVARSPQEAEAIAIAGVRSAETLNASLLNAADDPPRVTVTHHYEVESFETIPSADLGYIFYRDHESRPD